MSQNSVILKLIALPIAIFVSCMGIMTILGGHITPGGGFQGGAMITAGVILCILVYGLDKSPINFSHNFVDIVESFGILVYIGLGLVGLFFAGAFLYNVGKRGDAHEKTNACAAAGSALRRTDGLRRHLGISEPAGAGGRRGGPSGGHAGGPGGLYPGMRRGGAAAPPLFFIGP